jgi:aryl-alcohol dehydrogenase-like predicted oxidoreductase
MQLKSKIGLGTVQFGMPYGISNKQGQTAAEEVGRILKLASTEGIAMLDTASGYGSAEEILGINPLTGFRIVSKFLPPAHGETLPALLQRSLKKLQLTSLYGYLSHRPMDVFERPWQWDELKKLKEEGLITKTGFSLNAPDELERLLEKGFFPDLIQVPFNYFDQRFEKQMIFLKERGCEIHTRSTFLQGLFFTDPRQLSPFFETVKPLITELQNSVAQLSGVLLRFVLEKPFVDHVIIGVENCAQLVANLEGITTGEKLPALKHVIDDQILMPACWPKQ